MHDLVLVPDPDLGPVAGPELRELARLTAEEDERVLAPQRYGPVEGLAMLRRRLHGIELGALEVLDVPACAIIVALPDGSAGWTARGLDTLDDRQLLAFSRRALEVVHAVTREQVRREVHHG